MDLTEDESDYISHSTNHDFDTPQFNQGNKHFLYFDGYEKQQTKLSSIIDEIQKFDTFIEKIEKSLCANKIYLYKNDSECSKEQLISKLNNRIVTLEENVQFLMNSLVS